MTTFKYYNKMDNTKYHKMYEVCQGDSIKIISAFHPIFLENNKRHMCIEEMYDDINMLKRTIQDLIDEIKEIKNKDKKINNRCTSLNQDCYYGDGVLYCAWCDKKKDN